MRLLIFVFLALAFVSNAQTDTLAVIYGTVKDTTGEPLIGATLKILKNGVVVKGTITDFNGNYRIQIEPGEYDLEVNYAGFQKLETKGVSSADKQSLMQNFELEYSPTSQTYWHCYFWAAPLIDFAPGNTGEIFSASQIRNRY